MPRRRFWADPAAGVALGVMAAWGIDASRAGETTFTVASLPDPVVLWTPEDYDDQPARQWPVVYWYPGTGGRPSVDYIRRHTDGKGWIIVGMGFRDPGRGKGDEASIATEMAILRGVRDRVEREYRIRPARSFVGGFSKGGWVSGVFVVRDPTLAGVLIMGAGLFDPPPGAGEKTASRPRRLAYIGIGELDGNRAMSQRAARDLPLLNTVATLDVWDGLGHTAPDRSESLRQWLRSASAESNVGAVIDPLRTEAVEWFDREFGRLTGEKTDAGTLPQRYFALEKLSRMPFFATLDDESRTAAKETLAEWSARPDLAAELAVQRQFFEILDRESRDRQVGTLAICREDYRRLAEAAPQTIFGAAAARAEKRTAEMLKAAGAAP